MSKSPIIKFNGADQTDLEDFQLKQFAKKKKMSPETLKEYTFASLTEVSGPPEVTFTQAKETLKQAQETLAKARSEAEKIKRKAQQEGEKIKEKARIEGFAQGREQGLTEGKLKGEESYKSALAETWRVIEAIGNFYQNLKKANEAIMVKLALTMAERVVLHEVNHSPEAIIAAFKAAMDVLDNMHEVVLRAHPDDIAQLESVRPEITSQSNGAAKVTITPDPGLAKGDLVVETESGLIDATLKKRLQAVAEAIDEELKKNFDLDW